MTTMPRRAPLTGTILLSLVGILAGMGAGCGSASRAAPVVPTTTAAVVPKPPVQAAAPKDEQGAKALPPLPEKDTVVVIDSGGGKHAKPPATLLEASKAEKERRQERTKQGAHPIVITDSNLKTFATGKLTTAKPAHAADKEQKAADKGQKNLKDKGAGKAVPDADAPGAEKYWRNRVLEIRRRWHDAVKAQDDLEGKIAKLRREFYAADDPYYRDSQIKPAWDKALADLDSARQEAKDAQDQLATALEAGRKAGAPPGWLREGVELEPKPTAKPDHEPKPAPEPGEPQITEPNSGPPTAA